MHHHVAQVALPPATVVRVEAVGSDVVVQLHVSRLELRNQTERALGKSEEMAANAVSELEQLLNLTNAKVKTLEEQVTSNVSFGTTLVVVIVLASLIIAFFTGYKTVNAITIPLKKVNDLLNIASSGDLTHNLDDSSQDEFGQLAKNCNKLILSLKELIRGINVRAEQLAAASEQTDADGGDEPAGAARRSQHFVPLGIPMGMSFTVTFLCVF